MVSHITQGIYTTYSIIHDVYQHRLIQNSLIQKVIGISYFTLGFIGIYKIVQDCWLNQKIKKPYEDKDWKPTALKIIDLLGNLSLLGNGLTSQPARFICRWAVRVFLSESHIQYLFGSQSFLAIHRLIMIIKVISLLLSIPSSIKTTYDCYKWIKKKIQLVKSAFPEESTTNSKTKLVILFNTFVGGTFLSFQMLREPSIK